MKKQKFDRHNDFRDLPKIYSSVEDIEKFISERNVDIPFINHILKLRHGKMLNMTPTESKFIFDETFDYIYDVFRVPDEENYLNVENWLRYIEGNLVEDGMSGLKRRVYHSVSMSLNVRVSLNQILGKDNDRKYDLINYHLNIGEHPYPKFYIDDKAKESFWIKTSSSGQPLDLGDEHYMRVHVYDDRVYIKGCDDCSWTLFSDDIEKLNEFVIALKIGAPVWNSCFFDIVFPNLEFTN